MYDYCFIICCYESTCITQKCCDIITFQILSCLTLKKKKDTFM